MLAREGWTRNSIREHIKAQAKIPFETWIKQYHGSKEATRNVPETVFATKDPNAMIPKPFFEALHIIVAGGTGEKSMILPCWAAGRMVSQEIRLPYGWQ